MEFELKPGDIFCTRNPMWLGRAINGVQRFWSSDGESKYSHAGIILNSDGLTLEALWTIREQNLFSAYAGCQVLIGRHVNMNPEAFREGMIAVNKYRGRWYPFHRLVFHLFPPAAKYISTGRYVVCSELAAKFLVAAKCMRQWRGKNPDHLADMIRKWRTWDVVSEGALKAD